MSTVRLYAFLFFLINLLTMNWFVHSIVKFPPTYVYQLAFLFFECTCEMLSLVHSCQLIDCQFWLRQVWSKKNKKFLINFFLSWSRTGLYLLNFSRLLFNLFPYLSKPIDSNVITWSDFSFSNQIMRLDQFCLLRLIQTCNCCLLSSCRILSFLFFIDFCLHTAQFPSSCHLPSIS